MRNLLLPASDERICKRYLTSDLDFLAGLLGTVLTVGFVELDWITEVVNFPNLSDRLSDLVDLAGGRIANEEPDAERMSIEGIPKS